jgi:hypothetical protein
MGLLRLAQCRRLENFCISSFSSWTDKALKKILGLPLLQSLHICVATGVTPEGIRRAFQQKTSAKLTNLSLTKLPQVTSSVFRVIAMACPELESLTLMMMRNLGNGAVLTISQYCTALQELELLQVNRVKPAGVAALVPLLPKLRVFKVQLCRLLTHPFMEWLVERHPAVRFPYYFQFVPGIYSDWE